MRILRVISIIAACLTAAVGQAAPPNIVFVITDDQGYGDLGQTGNPVVKTPNIDRLAAESSQLKDYHAAPTCSPTRAALLTGHWTDRTGVWHTVNGRSMLRKNEVTLGQMLKEAGYATGMFGKWHLGDNFPYRPEDRGFTEVYRHGGGGVGQTSDLWDNAYFDGSYFHNGQAVPAKGFCTDVLFAEAHRFIRESAARKQPFLAYIALNALRDANKLTPAQADVFLAPRPAEELYFTARDPEQLRNLVNDPTHAETKTRLAALLDQRTEETGDAAPDKLTADTFDRETGVPLDRVKSNSTADRGDFPGKPQNASLINAPGPR